MSKYAVLNFSHFIYMKLDFQGVQKQNSFPQTFQACRSFFTRKNTIFPYSMSNTVQSDGGLILRFVNQTIHNIFHFSPLNSVRLHYISPCSIRFSSNFRHICVTLFLIFNTRALLVRGSNKFSEDHKGSAAKKLGTHCFSPPSPVYLNFPLRV
jgi:hypothetical protein